MKKWLVWIGVLSIVSAVSGCAMMGMHGMGMMGDPHGGASEPTVVRLDAEDARAVLVIPPLVVGEPAMLSVRLNRIGDDAPITGARVSVEVVDMHRDFLRHVHHSSSEHMGLADEPVAGVYQLSHRFIRGGQYEIIAEVQIGSREEGKYLELSARQQVVVHSDHVGHKRSMSRDVLGIVAVVLMMGFMMGGTWLF